MPGLTIRIPGRVHYDYLDPQCTEMETALGLPEPRIVKAGKGKSYIYEDVDADTARDLVEYVYGRADMLVGQGVADPYDIEEKREMDIHRTALRVAEKITDALRDQR